MSNYHFLEKTVIDKGWSGDVKYCAVDETGQKYLLRVSPREQYDRKRGTFEMMQRTAALGIPMCRALEFGECSDGVYMVQTWIDGEDSEQALPRYSPAQQYAYGVDAGRILRRIHSQPAPENAEDWETRFNKKIDRKIRMYGECSLKYPDGDRIIDFINAHRHLLKDRPQAIHHGDYHSGNLMIDIDGVLTVIDFDRDDHGDPWEEFNRIVWCIAVSHPFASGMVNGYFDDDVPMEFWQLLALYICTNTLSSLPWAIPFGDVEIKTMRKQEQSMMGWYDGLTRVVPNWYIAPETAKSLP